MTYVVQQPHSLTNDTDNYRVVEYSAWLAEKSLPLRPAMRDPVELG